MQRTGLRRDELTTLADIGALNAFTNERRSALWQVERAVRPAGELFAGSGIGDSQRPSTTELLRTMTELPNPDRSPIPEPPTDLHLRAMDRRRAPAGRLRRHGPDHRAASDGAAPRRAGAARRAARLRSAAARATAAACAWPAW